MAAISNFPKGLISLVGLNDMGEAPRDLAAQIVPTLDVTQFFLTNRETIIDTNTIGGVGATYYPNFDVPTGQLWRVHAVSFYAPGAVGTPAWKGAPIYTEVNQPVALTANASALATEGQIMSTQNMFWAVPGSRFGFYCTAWAANFTLTANIIISRFRI